MKTIHPPVSLSLSLPLPFKTMAGVAGSPHTRSLRCFSHYAPGLNYHPLLSCAKTKKSMLELHRQQLPHSCEGSPGSVCAVGTQSHAVSSTAQASISEAPRCVQCRSTPRGFQPVSCLLGKSSVWSGRKKWKGKWRTAQRLLRLKILQMILNQLEVPGLLCWF